MQRTQREAKIFLGLIALLRPPKMSRARVQGVTPVTDKRLAHQRRLVHRLRPAASQHPLQVPLRGMQRMAQALRARGRKPTPAEVEVAKTVPVVTEEVQTQRLRHRLSLSRRVVISR